MSNFAVAAPPDFPTHMTWDELDALPEELARQIELHEGRVVFVRTGPPPHTRFGVRLRNAMEQCARADMRTSTGACWQVDTELNVFFNGDKTDFRTPDFMVYHCQESPEHYIHAHDVVLVGEVLSPANTHSAIETKKAKYASAGIPWYWEVDLDGGAIAAVRAYVLSRAVDFPEGVVPLRPHNYFLVDQWTPADAAEIVTAHPFPIRIAWADLAF